MARKKDAQEINVSCVAELLIPGTKEWNFELLNNICTSNFIFLLRRIQWLRIKGDD